MNKKRNIILIGVVTLFIVTLGCIGSTEDKTANAPLPTPSETAGYEYVRAESPDF